ncbi:unnamed protein product, partial [Rotaria sordida]
MYAPPNSGNVAATTLDPVTATITCLACLLFILAATIVLALIPVYTPTKTAKLNPNAKESNWNRMYLAVGDTAVGGRKRQALPTKTLRNYVGGIFGPYGNTLVENGIRKVLRVRRQFEDVTVSSVIVTSEANGREKRLSLAKRQLNSTVVLAVKFVIFFANTCDYGCQLNVGHIFKSLLENNLPSALFLINVPILNKNGELIATISSIPIIGVLSITNI